MFVIKMTMMNGSISYITRDDGSYFSSMDEALEFFKTKTQNCIYDVFFPTQQPLFLLQSNVGVIDCTNMSYIIKLPYSSFTDLYHKMREGGILTVGTAGGSFTYHSYQIVACATV